MSTFEYNDLYLKCQNNGTYHVFIFDIINSKNMDKEYRYLAQLHLIKLMNNIYEELKKIEQTQNKKILVFEEDFITFESNQPSKTFGLKQEPFLFGDTFGFTVYTNSIEKETIYKIYNHQKRLLNIDFDFHLADGLYETNDYSEANNKYFRGYCIDLLTKLHKKETIKSLRKLQNKK